MIRVALFAAALLAVLLPSAPAKAEVGWYDIAPIVARGW